MGTKSNLVILFLAFLTTSSSASSAVATPSSDEKKSAVKPSSLRRRLDDHEDHDHEDEDHDDDDGCFSGSDTVELEGGALKRLSDVAVGDKVLSADRLGALSYSDVVFLPHGPDGKATSFLDVAMASGKALQATPQHILKTCGGAHAYAADLKAGDCLSTQDGDETVTSVANAPTKALPYTAVTLNEYLVVGGVVASPFAVNHGLVHAYYSMHRALYLCGFKSYLASPNAMNANAMAGSSAILAFNTLGNLVQKYSGAKSLK